MLSSGVEHAEVKPNFKEQGIIRSVEKRPKPFQHNQMLTHPEFILIEEESVVGYEAMRGCREVMGKVEK